MKLEYRNVLGAPLPLAGEHRPPSAAVLRKERRSEASAMALVRARRVGEISQLAPLPAEVPPPQPSPASGRGCSPSMLRYRATASIQTSFASSTSPLPLWERSDCIARCNPGEGLRSIDRPGPPTPTLPRKRERGLTAVAARSRQSLRLIRL